MSKFNKIVNYLSFEMIKKKMWVNYQRIFTQKIVKNMVLGSGIRETEQTHSGSWIQGSKKAPDPGAVLSLTVDKVIQSLFQAPSLSRDGKLGGGQQQLLSPIRPTGHGRHRCEKS
jgi:hypothetical protein